MYHRHTKSGTAAVREVASSEFKDKLHEWLDRVAQGNEEIVITRYGKPVAKLSPMGLEGPESSKLFGSMRGTVSVVGDIVEPVGVIREADG